MILVHAYEELKYTPKALLALPETENQNVDELSYAYWLEYIYQIGRAHV